MVSARRNLNTEPNQGFYIALDLQVTDRQALLRTSLQKDKLKPRRSHREAGCAVF